MLFVLTLIITFPSLYVFNALLGSQLSALSTLRLLVATLVVTMAVLASFGPIVAFFSVSTTSYSFMVLLNVAMCAVAGLLRGRVDNADRLRASWKGSLLFIAVCGCAYGALMGSAANL